MQVINSLHPRPQTVKLLKSQGLTQKQNCTPINPRHTIFTSKPLNTVSAWSRNLFITGINPSEAWEYSTDKRRARKPRKLFMHPVNIQHGDVHRRTGLTRKRRAMFSLRNSYDLEGQVCHRRADDIKMETYQTKRSIQSITLTVT